MTLDQLADRVAKKDGQAFEIVYDQLRGPVYAVCLGILNNRYDAEDIMQETFLTVWTKADRFRGTGFKTWVLTIAKHQSLNALKQREREIPVDLSEAAVENQFSRAGGPPGILPDNPSYDQPDEMKSILSLALERLGDTERQIVTMRTSGLKVKEIAALLEMPRSTVSWHYAEAVKKLKKWVKEEMRA